MLVIIFETLDYDVKYLCACFCFWSAVHRLEKDEKLFLFLTLLVLCYASREIWTNANKHEQTNININQHT